jgi:prepilin-type N-terminal cleavage/methylation domain-containing protein/prepilin-type processing-associated H-X9-DG protein
MRGVWRKGFTLIELLVVIAIVAILAGILFPVFSKAREKARQVSCINNLRQLGIAVMMYAEAYDETLPLDASNCRDGLPSQVCSRWNPEWRIEAKIRPYTKNEGVFACSSSANPPVVWDASKQACGWNRRGYPEFMCYSGNTTGGKPLSYGWNQAVFQICVPRGGCGAPGVALAEIARTSNKIMAGDSRHQYVDPTTVAFANYPDSSPAGAENAPDYWTDLPPAGGPAIHVDGHTRHIGGSNVLRFDGSVKWLGHSELTGAPFGDLMRTWFELWPE